MKTLAERVSKASPGLVLGFALLVAIWFRVMASAQFVRSRVDPPKGVLALQSSSWWEFRELVRGNMLLIALACALIALHSPPKWMRILATVTGVLVLGIVLPTTFVSPPSYSNVSVLSKVLNVLGDTVLLVGVLLALWFCTRTEKSADAPRE